MSKDRKDRPSAKFQEEGSEWRHNSGETVEAVLSQANLPASEFWEDRHALHELQKRSAEAYQAMSNEKREAIIKKLKRSMAVMHDNIDEWIPDSLRMEANGDTLRVELNFLAADLEVEMDLLSSKTSFEIEEAVRRTEEAMREMEEMNRAWHIQQLDPLEFATYVRPNVSILPGFNYGTFCSLAHEVQVRVRSVEEVAPLVAFIFNPLPFNEELWQSFGERDLVKEFLTLTAGSFGEVPWSEGALRTAASKAAAVVGLNTDADGLIQQILRVALSGASSGLPIYSAMSVMDRSDIQARLLDVAALVPT